MAVDNSDFLKFLLGRALVLLTALAGDVSCQTKLDTSACQLTFFITYVRQYIDIITTVVESSIDANVDLGMALLEADYRIEVPISMRQILPIYLFLVEKVLGSYTRFSVDNNCAFGVKKLKLSLRVSRRRHHFSFKSVL